MRKNILFIILLCTSFLEAQETSITYYDLFTQQIKELEEQKDFITKSACPVNKESLRVYKENYKILAEALNIATLVYNTPISIAKNRIVEQGEKFVKYQSNTIPEITIERHGPRTSMAGLVSDNSNILVGTKLLTESFNFKNKAIEAQYRVGKKMISLLSLKVVYPNKDRVYLDLSAIRQSNFSVFSTTEYGTELKKLHVYFDPINIGKISWIETPSYELYQENYLEPIKDMPNRKLKKSRYAIRCYNDLHKQITPKQTGSDIAVKPSNYLLWYDGFIGDYPIKMMLKRGFNTETQDEEILNIAYGYNSTEKWIYIQNLHEPQAGIFGYEKGSDSPQWYVEFEYNQTLKGDWDNQNGTILPITLTPMSKILHEFNFKATIEEELAPSGEVSNQLVNGLSIYKNEKLIQHIKLDQNFSIDLLKLNYVDINYDGYLDLVVNNQFFLYKPKSNNFNNNAYNNGYYMFLDDLEQYNLFNKSFIAQMNRKTITYKATGGVLEPFYSNSYFQNKEGNMVFLEEKYENGKWVIIEENGEVLDADNEINTNSSQKYVLNLNLTPHDGMLYFTPKFYNKNTKKLIFKEKAKLYVEIIDENKKVYEQYIYQTKLSDKKEQLLDDAAILFNGKSYLLNSHKDKVPFFPPNLKNGSYTFRLKLKHPLLSDLYSDAQQIQLPLDLKTTSNYIHLNGNIGSRVNGGLYLVIDNSAITGTFINDKTNQRIKLKASLKGTKLVIKEYEKEGEISGYFEGDFIDGIYTGNWLSPNKKIQIPFKFKEK